MKVSVFINKIHQESGAPTTITAANGGEFGPPLIQLNLTEQQRRDINPRIGMPIHVTLDFDQ